MPRCIRCECMGTHYEEDWIVYVVIGRHERLGAIITGVRMGPHLDREMEFVHTYVVNARGETLGMCPRCILNNPVD